MPCKPYILNTYFFMLTACHPEQHSRCFDRFCCETVMIGIGSLFVGLLIGVGLSQFMSAVVATAYLKNTKTGAMQFLQIYRE